MSMIDEGKIKDKIIERLMEEARKLVGLEVDHLRRLGYVLVADALEEWLPLIEDWDVEIEAGIVDETPGEPLTPLSAEAKESRKPLPPHVLANARSEKIHEDKGNLRASKQLKRAQDSRKPLRDANGELLEVGDLVQFEGFPRIYVVTEFGSVRHLTPELEGPAILDRSGVRKLTSLTEEQYLPLARRTLPDDMTQKERLSMLVMGCIGEAEEVYRVSRKYKYPLWADDMVKEIGDLEWYATLLADECQKMGIKRPDDQPPTIVHPAFDAAAMMELLKKAIFHNVDQYHLADLTLAAQAYAESWAGTVGVDLGEIRLANIQKLIARYPDGFVNGGGER